MLKTSIGPRKQFPGFSGAGETNPNSQERGGYEVDFQEGGEIGIGEDTEPGKRQLPTHPGRHRATSPGPGKSASKIAPPLSAPLRMRFIFCYVTREREQRSHHCLRIQDFSEYQLSLPE